MRCSVLFDVGPWDHPLWLAVECICVSAGMLARLDRCKIGECGATLLELVCESLY